VHTFPLSPYAGPEVGIIGLTAPQNLREGDRFSVTVELFSSVVMSADLRLYVAGILFQKRELSLQPGSNFISFDGLEAVKRSMLLEVMVSSEEDFYAANNRHQQVLTVDSPPLVVLIEPSLGGQGALDSALRDSKLELQRMAPEAFAASHGAWTAADLLILSNTHSAMLPGEVVSDLADWVRKGGGSLLVTGGPMAFGAGGYQDSPISALLPVDSRHADLREDVDTAIMVVLDRSGSMATLVGERSKMSLANEGTLEVLSAIQPGDSLGVLAVDVNPEVILPLEPVGDMVAAADTIRSIGVGGGGIYAYQAFTEAWRQLRLSPASNKHLILFADADDVEEKREGEEVGKVGGADALDLVTIMLGSGVSTSVVALGHESDKDTSWLREVARRGNGRFFLTSNAAELPALFALAAGEATRSSLYEKPFFASASPAGSLLFPGIPWEEAPPLFGCNETRIRPGADLWLLGPVKLPLLAHWRLGLGRVAAWTTDTGNRWAKEWPGWSGYAELWHALVRQLVSPTDRRDLEVEFLPEEKGDVLLSILVHGEEDGAVARQFFPSVSVVGEGRQPATPQVQLAGPGRFVATISRPETPILISVRSGDGSSSVRSLAFSPPPSREFHSGEQRLEQLESMALRSGGNFVASPGEVLASIHPSRAGEVNLSPWLLGVAAMILVIEVGWRRRIGM